MCDGIHGHDFIIAEVTESNSNVLLEIGYALAVGRQPILLIDQNRPKWERRLLATLESCHYQTREDIHEFIIRLSSYPRKIPTNPDRRLPMLESMGIFEREEQPGTVYHLRPKLVTDPIKRIDSVLSSSFFKPTSMDPTDSVYDEFYNQARKIQESELIVASLVSSNYTSDS